MSKRPDPRAQKLIQAYHDSLTCPRCSQTGGHVRAKGSAVYAERLDCGGCGRFLRWLPGQGTRPPDPDDVLRPVKVYRVEDLPASSRLREDS